MTAQRCRFLIKIYEVPRNHFSYIWQSFSTFSFHITHHCNPSHHQKRLGEIMYHCNIKSPWGMFVVGSWYLTSDCPLWISTAAFCTFLDILTLTSLLHVQNDCKIRDSIHINSENGENHCKLKEARLSGKGLFYCIRKCRLDGYGIALSKSKWLHSYDV